jgi:hypothetical protein
MLVRMWGALFFGTPMRDHQFGREIEQGRSYLTGMARLLHLTGMARLLHLTGMARLLHLTGMARLLHLTGMARLLHPPGMTRGHVGENVETVAGVRHQNTDPVAG